MIYVPMPIKPKRSEFKSKKEFDEAIKTYESYSKSHDKILGHQLAFSISLGIICVVGMSILAVDMIGAWYFAIIGGYMAIHYTVLKFSKILRIVKAISDLDKESTSKES
jgi:hypothetical protein